MLLGDIVCPPSPITIAEWRWENPSSFLSSRIREKKSQRTASKNAFKNSGETPVGVKRGRVKDKEGCIRNSTYNHRVEMHRDGKSTFGFNRIAPRTGPVVTTCHCSLRHSDRMQERASSQVLVVIIALKSLSYRHLMPLRCRNFLSETSIVRGSL